MNKELLAEAYYLWEDFKEIVKYNKRYYVKHKVLDLVDLICAQREACLNEDSKVYRARIYKADASFIDYLKEDSFAGLEPEDEKAIKSVIEKKRETNFWGYNEEESFVPKDQDKIKGGRANPEYISYLYAADDVYTAIVEVRPYLKSMVSVSEIAVLSDIKLADLSDYSAFTEEDTINEGLEYYLLYWIMQDFQIPNDNDSKQYIPTQHITEYIRSLGFDGIKFRSSLYMWGSNFVIFDASRCKSVNSKLIRVSNIYLKCESIVPKGEEPSSIDMLYDMVMQRSHNEDDVF